MCKHDDPIKYKNELLKNHSKEKKVAKVLWFRIN